MAESDGGEKTHAPSQKRLEDARRKGQIPRSPDLLSASAFVGLIGAFIMIGTLVIRQSASAVTILLEGDNGTLVRDAVLAMLAPVIPIFVIPAMCVLIALFFNVH